LEKLSKQAASASTDAPRNSESNLKQINQHLHEIANEISKGSTGGINKPITREITFSDSGVSTRYTIKVEPDPKNSKKLKVTITNNSDISDISAQAYTNCGKKAPEEKKPGEKAQRESIEWSLDKKTLAEDNSSGLPGNIREKFLEMQKTTANLIREQSQLDVTNQMEEEELEAMDVETYNPLAEDEDSRPNNVNFRDREEDFWEDDVNRIQDSESN
jgi:hypothetical protein